MDRHALAAIFSRNIKTVGSFVGLVALLAASPASATLTLIDDPVFGPMSLVLDTTTNLEWLRVDFTDLGGGGGYGNPIAVLDELGPGQKFAGFRVAGTNNWAGLMGEFGFPTRPGPPDCFGDIPCSIDPTVEAKFTSLFGIPLETDVAYNVTPPPPQFLFDGVFFSPVVLWNILGSARAALPSFATCLWCAMHLSQNLPRSGCSLPVCSRFLSRGGCSPTPRGCIRLGQLLLSVR
jgi:hypothetical protein